MKLKWSHSESSSYEIKTCWTSFKHATVDLEFHPFLSMYNLAYLILTRIVKAVTYTIKFYLCNKHIVKDMDTALLHQMTKWQYIPVFVYFLFVFHCLKHIGKNNLGVKYYSARIITRVSVTTAHPWVTFWTFLKYLEGIFTCNFLTITSPSALSVLLFALLWKFRVFDPLYKRSGLW